MKKFLISLTLALGFATAQAAPAPPDVAVRETTEKMRTLIAENVATYKADPVKFNAVVEEVLVPRFDVAFIAKYVLGKYWKQATPEQRTRFAAAFKNALVQGYADKLLEYYDTVNVEFKPVKLVGGETDATVRSTLKLKDARNINVSFNMHLVDGEWKVWDVIVENLSFVTNYRGQFTAKAQKDGIEGLIKGLEAGNTTLVSGGTAK